MIELLLCNSPKCKLKFMGHWLRYSTTPNVPTRSTQSSQAKNLALSIFVATFTRSLLMFWFRQQTKVNTNLSVIAPNNGTTSSTKIHGYGIPQQSWPQICSKTLTTASKLGAIFRREKRRWFWSQSLWDKNDKNRLQSFLNVCDFLV